MVERHAWNLILPYLDTLHDFGKHAAVEKIVRPENVQVHMNLSEEEARPLQHAYARIIDDAAQCSRILSVSSSTR